MSPHNWDGEEIEAAIDAAFPAPRRTDAPRPRITDTWTCPRCNRAPVETFHPCGNLPPLTQEQKNAADYQHWYMQAEAELARLREAGEALRWYLDRAGDPITRDQLHDEATRRFQRALVPLTPTEGK